MTHIDEYGDPTDDQLLWWQEANDHAEEGDQHDEGFDEADEAPSTAASDPSDAPF